LHLLATLVAGT